LPANRTAGAFRAIRSPPVYEFQHFVDGRDARHQFRRDDTMSGCSQQPVDLLVRLPVIVYTDGLEHSSIRGFGRRHTSSDTSENSPTTTVLAGPRIL
jgi:hypothetical protein